MLCDDVAAVADDDRERALLDRAHRFVFSSEAVVAARALAINENNASEWMKLAALPFHTCWFEFLAADVCAGEWATQKKRWGIWFCQHPTDDLNVARDWTSDQFGEVMGAPDYFELNGRNHQPALNLITRCLILMNTKNMVEREAVEFNNARRVARGKRPLLSYHTCNIRRGVRLGREPAQANESDTAIRAHVVRGHIKLRKKGAFYWSPFVRGNPELGFIGKKYHV
jgi:hypothetical protein